MMNLKDEKYSAKPQYGMKNWLGCLHRTTKYFNADATVNVDLDHIVPLRTSKVCTPRMCIYCLFGFAGRYFYKQHFDDMTDIFVIATGN